MDFRLSAAAVSLALVLTACGGAKTEQPIAAGTQPPSTDSAPSPVVADPLLPQASAPAPTSQIPAAQPPEPAAPTQPKALAAKAVSDLPAVTVADVLTGAEVNLASLAPSSLPTLPWFYAPH